MCFITSQVAGLLLPDWGGSRFDLEIIASQCFHYRALWIWVCKTGPVLDSGFRGDQPTNYYMHDAGKMAITQQTSYQHAVLSAPVNMSSTNNHLFIKGQEHVQASPGYARLQIHYRQSTLSLKEAWMGSCSSFHTVFPSEKNSTKPEGEDPKQGALLLADQKGVSISRLFH